MVKSSQSWTAGSHSIVTTSLEYSDMDIITQVMILNQTY